MNTNEIYNYSYELLKKMHSLQHNAPLALSGYTRNKSIVERVLNAIKQPLPQLAFNNSNEQEKYNSAVAIIKHRNMLADECRVLLSWMASDDCAEQYYNFIKQFKATCESDLDITIFAATAGNKFNPETMCCPEEIPQNATVVINDDFKYLYARDRKTKQVVAKADIPIEALTITKYKTKDENPEK